MDSTTELTTPPPTPGVNPTPGTPGGVNPAQSPSATDQIVNTSALIANYEGRIRSLMSDKDKAINERNQAISNLTAIQSQLTTLQEQTAGSLTAAANSAQQAIDRAHQMEQDLTLERAKGVKLTALMQRPHLAPYADLIPAQGDAAAITAALDQLEQIRQQDLDRYTKQNPLAPTPPTTPTTPTPQSILASLYGNRANMNPALFQQTTPVVPSSSPAQMSPDYSNDPAKATEALFAEARRIGTSAAFEDARTKAIALSNSLLQR